MSFDFMKNLPMSEDEERFARLCESIEDLIREAEEGSDKFTDLELMQALDSIGFRLFRDNWEEFKKMGFSYESMQNSNNRKNLIN